MHRFYMVQSFTRFHRNVSIVCHSTLPRYSCQYVFSVKLMELFFYFPSPGYFSCRALPRCKGRGAAPKAGTCYQGGPCMPQSSGSFSRCTQWCKCWAAVKIACNCALCPPRWVEISSPQCYVLNILFWNCKYWYCFIYISDCFVVFQKQLFGCKPSIVEALWL